MKKMNLERNELIYNLYFKDKLTISEISKKIDLSISQISRILSKSPLYQQEKLTEKKKISKNTMNKQKKL